MNGIFGTTAPLLSDLSLIASILLGAAAAFGGIQAKKKHFKKHCPIMAYAAFLNWLPILAVMVPALIGVLQGTRTLAAGAFASMPIFHGILGTLTQVLMTYTVIRMYWVETLPPKKTIWLMRITMTLWLLTVFGGIGVYAVSYML